MENTSDSRKVRVLNPEYQPAGFWIRVAGSFLDGIFAHMAFILVAAISWMAGVRSVEALLTEVGLGGIYLLIFLYYAAYIALSWSYLSTTPGKKLLGLMPIDADSKKTVSVIRGLLRELPAKYIAAIPLNIGFAMVGLRKDKRGLHDLIARTQVVRRIHQ